MSKLEYRLATNGEGCYIIQQRVRFTAKGKWGAWCRVGEDIYLDKYTADRILRLRRAQLTPIADWKPVAEYRGEHE